MTVHESDNRQDLSLRGPAVTVFRGEVEIPQWQDWRQAAYEIKQYALANLDRLLVEFERNLTAKGVEVLFAAGTADFALV